MVNFTSSEDFHNKKRNLESSGQWQREEKTLVLYYSADIVMNQSRFLIGEVSL